MASLSRGIPRDEQETIFRWSADEDVVSVFTAHLPTHRKLTRAGYVPHRVNRHGGREAGWFYRVPLGEFRWRVAVKPRRWRPATPEQRERLARARLGAVSLSVRQETARPSAGGGWQAPGA
jgi:hypothetical protein